MSIRYFDVKETGIYTIILTSLAQENMNYEVELGSTNALIISISRSYVCWRACYYYSHHI